MSATLDDVSSFGIKHPGDREQSLALKELADALSKAQAEIKHVQRDNEVQGTKFSYRYADLAAVLDACREPLARNGLALVQQPVGDGARIGIATTLLHRSGQYMTSTVYASPADRGPQAIGSVISYLRRYSAMAIVGLAADDDDGAAAGGGRPNVPRPANDNAAPKSARRAGPPPAHAGPSAPSSPGASPPPGPTLKQQRKYRELSEAMGISGDEARTRVTKFLGREVSGLNDVTPAEMDRLIEAMEAQKNATS